MRNFQWLLCAVVITACNRGHEQGPRPSSCESDWSQWGLSGSHAGTSCATAQPMIRPLVDIVYDPFVADEMADSGGDLLAHYQSPLISGDDVFIEAKSGDYVPCNPPGSGSPAPCGTASWSTQLWTERKYTWKGSDLQFAWRVASDWKPPPNANHLGGWEPVFHGALGPADLWLPGANGSVLQVAKDTGAVKRRIDPFSGDANAYVAGPITVDPQGNAVWTVIRFGTNTQNPWTSDAHGALVRATPAGTWRVVSLDGLIPDAPAATDQCELSYAYDRRNPPPLPLVDASGNVQAPPTASCGAQRPALNVAPAAAADGSIYFVSRAHRNERYAYLVALTPALDLRFAASFRGLVNDGCGVTVRKDGAGGDCRVDAQDGIDPETGRDPAQRATDDSTASPVVLPDGSVIVGTFTAYNAFRGHLLKFGPQGTFLGAFDFGWDTTPSVFAHDGTYSIVLKDNHYDEGPFYLTQLAADLSIEWQYKSDNVLSCARQPDGSVQCVDDHQHEGGFEWCVNAMVIDAQGVVYANSEDGHLYAIYQGGAERQRLFLNLALGAAYTPLAIDAKGRLYTQNAGHLYVVGTGE